MTVHLYRQCPYVEVENDVWLYPPFEFASSLDCEACIAVITSPSMADDPANAVRVLWHEAISARWRVRHALHALGFDAQPIGADPNLESLTPGHLLPTYTESFVGDLGIVTVQWNGAP